jgi:hypothetical protein
MTGSAEHKPLEPNVDVMLEFLELMFGGDRCGELHDCWIELGYTDSAGNLCKAAHFKTDELDKLAEHAARLNRIEGTNTYISLALRKKDIRLNHRTGKEAVAGVVTLWSDLDDKGAAEQMKERARFCLPTHVVVTGRTPHLRAQGFWRIDEPMTDIAQIEDALGSIQRALGGDRAVVDASRMMRLPGSLAYPHKPERVLELTELVTTFKEKPRPTVYPAGQVCRAFKPKSAGGQADEPEQPQGQTGSAGSGPSGDDPHAKNPFTGQFNPQALLASIRPGNWYVPMRDFVAHMVGRGRQDWEIRAMTARYEEPGHQGITVQDIIDKTRAKWNKPNPADPAEAFDFSQEPPKPLAPESAEDIVLKNIRRRPWLFGTWLLKGYLTMLIGTGGQGKSMLAIHVALAVASGMAWAGQKVRESGGVWIWNNEDDRDELHRRIGGTAKHLGIDLKSLGGNRLFANSGVDDGSGNARKLIVAKAGDHGSVIATPDVADVVQHIKDKGIKLLIVDPFVSTHSLNENDNPQMEAVTFLYRQIAHQADCSVMLVHHVSKPGDTDQAGNQHASRGASSITAAARVVLTVAPMTDADAKRAMGEDYPEKERENCIRVDTGKANLSAPGKGTVILRKVSVSLENGSETHVEDDADEIGGLEVADFSDFQMEAKVREQDLQNGLREMVATCMEGVAVGGEIDMTTLVSMILARTERFGKKSSLRQELLIAIPPAHQGGIRIREYLFDTRRAGAHKTATIYVCKRGA